jgi:hypothetical protein
LVAISIVDDDDDNDDDDDDDEISIGFVAESKYLIMTLRLDVVGVKQRLDTGFATCSELRQPPRSVSYEDCEKQV